MRNADYERYRDRIRKMLVKNQHLWYSMAKAKIATWRSLKRFAVGEVERPDVLLLNQIEDYITQQKKAA